MFELQYPKVNLVICVCMHIYTHKHTHTYIYIYIYIYIVCTRYTGHTSRHTAIISDYFVLTTLYNETSRFGGHRSRVYFRSHITYVSVQDRHTDLISVTGNNNNPYKLQHIYIYIYIYIYIHSSVFLTDT